MASPYEIQTPSPDAQASGVASLSSAPSETTGSPYVGYGALDAPAASAQGVTPDVYGGENSTALGLVQIKSPEQLSQDEMAAAQARQAQPVITGLAAHVRKCWDAAVIAKQEYQRKMLMAINQRKGIYEPEIRKAIDEQGGATIFMLLTDEKCVGAEAWLEELLLPADDKPWGLKPTPVPDLQPDLKAAVEREVKNQALMDVQKMMVAGQMIGQPVTAVDVQERLALVPQEIQDRLAKFARMLDVELESRIEDSLAQSGWRVALKDMIPHLTTFPSAIVKGPIPRKKKRMGWERGQDGQYEPRVVEDVEPDYEAVSPLDIYPAPMSRDVDDGYLIERHRLTRLDLVDLKGVDGYDDASIDMVLKEQAGKSLQNWLFEAMDVQRAHAEGRSFEMMDPEGRLDALQFWGFVGGQMLLDWGIDPQLIDDPTREYSAEVWLIGRNVIRAALNEDPLGRKPYYMTSFRKIPGSFWGMSLCEILADIQSVCNSAARALVNNMALSSGPQVAVDIGKMPEGENVTELFPWKIWQFDMGVEGGSAARPPMWFFQPNSTTAELLKIYEHFSREADTKSGIPRYVTGQEQTGGAMNTASGLSMMMGNAARGIKRVVKNIDFDYIEPSIDRQVEWDLLYNPGKMFRGDIRIQARGSTAMLQRESQQMRRAEALRLILSSPIALNSVGQDGVNAIISSVLRGLDIGVEQYIPDEADRKRGMFDAIMQRMAGLMDGQPGAGGHGGPPARTAGGATPGGGMGPGAPALPGESTPGAPPPRPRVPDPSGQRPAGGVENNIMQRGAV